MSWTNDKAKLHHIWTELQELQWTQSTYDDLEQARVDLGKGAQRISDEEFHILRKSFMSNIISTIGRVLDINNSVSLSQLKNSTELKFPQDFERRLKKIRKRHTQTTKKWRDKIIAHTDKNQTPDTTANQANLTRQTLEDLTNDLVSLYNETAKLNGLSPVFKGHSNAVGLHNVLFDKP